MKEFTKRGCTVNEILIGDVLPGEREMSVDEVNHLLKNSDALFVLGGDTRYMLDVITARSLGQLFINSLESGKLFSGTSAGAIWLAEVAMSDSEKFAKPVDWSFIMLKGLGVLPFLMTVHDDQGVAGGVSEVMWFNRSGHFAKSDGLESEVFDESETEETELYFGVQG
jgi:dipeptidase E